MVGWFCFWLRVSVRSGRAGSTWRATRPSPLRLPDMQLSTSFLPVHPPVANQRPYLPYPSRYMEAVWQRVNRDGCGSCAGTHTHTPTRPLHGPYAMVGGRAGGGKKGLTAGVPVRSRRRQAAYRCIRHILRSSGRSAQAARRKERYLILRSRHRGREVAGGAMKRDWTGPRTLTEQHVPGGTAKKKNTPRASYR